jgi:hypothetical protein
MFERALLNNRMHLPTIKTVNNVGVKIIPNHLYETSLAR